MPYKDPDAQLAYQRKWYAAHRSVVIARVKKRKWGEYAGTCVNCGRATVGTSKGKASDYCDRPECASAQRKARRDVFVEAGRAGRARQLDGPEPVVWNQATGRFEDAA